MASKSITLESSINFEYENKGPLNDAQRKIIIKHYVEAYHKERARENARALVEEIRRADEERLVHKTAISVYFGTARPHLFDSPRDYIFRRSKINR